MKIYRVWINQPSTQQHYHEYHGRKAHAVYPSDDEGYVRVYFLEGNILSMELPTWSLCISPGQLPPTRDNKCEPVQS